MKILTLTLKNLNSLKGKWQIDFTDPAYADSGIFAIIGQTGAGKTSILDAICLALYGKTPRIDNISKTTNEVMTRSTAECMAEVEIEVANKLYRCNFSQRRARKNPTGNLQDVTHTFSQIKHIGDDEALIIESKSSQTKKAIIETLGMDFEQFTRSVMLAQGQFSKFLKAKSDDRANILEKITGTDIYALISRRVFEKKRTNEQKLKELSATLDGIELLSEQQIQTIKDELQEHQKQHQQLTAQISQLAEHINWQQTLQTLTQTFETQKNQLCTAQTALSNFAPKTSQLAQAMQALEIDSDFKQLENTKKQHADNTSKEQEISKRISLEKDNLALSNKKLDLATIKQENCESTLNEQLPIINKVRELDNQLNSTKQKLEETTERHTQLSKTTQQRDTLVKNNQNKLVENTSELSTISQFLNTNAHHADLNSDRDLLVNICKSMKSHMLANVSVQQELSNNSQQGEQYNKQKTSLETQLQKVNQQIHDNKDELKTLQKCIDDILKQNKISDLRNQLTTLNNLHHQLNILCEQAHQLTVLQTTRDTLLCNQKALKTEHSQLNEKITLQTDKLSQIQSTLNDKTDNLALQQQVIKLEQHIHSLRDGEECPICGSTDHPYLKDLTNGSHPHYDTNNIQTDKLTQLQDQIQTLHNTLKTEQDLHRQIEREQVSVATKKEELDKQITEHSTQSEALIKKMQTSLLPELTHTLHMLNHKNKQHSNSLFIENINNTINELDSDVFSLTLTDTLSKQIAKSQADNQQQIHTREHAITEYEKLEQQLQLHKNSLDTLTHQHTNIQSSLADNIHHAKLFQQEIEHKQLTIQQNCQTIKSQLEDLSQLLSRHQETMPALLDAVNLTQVISQHQVEELFKELRALASDWQTRHLTFTTKFHNKLEIEKSISSLQSGLNQLTNQQSTDVKELKELSSKLTEQNQEYQTLLNQRQSLFNDKNPEQEENSLRSALKKAQISLNSAKENQQNSTNTVNHLTDTHNEVAVAIANLQRQLENQNKHFKTQLKKHGFADLNAYTSARLSQIEREQLEKQQNVLTADVTRLTALLNSTENALTTHQSNVPTPFTIRQLNSNPIAKEEPIHGDDSLNHNHITVNNVTTEHLLTIQTDIQTTVNELAEKIGANSQKISDQEVKLAKSNQHRQAIKKQLEDNQIWEQLNHLIGSSDGKKFRIFAQGLTFDVMIKNANQQLKKMSDRYLLIRDDASGTLNKEPLELSVIDNYQAGEIRSCKNLSGGESFIISLALALGLSQMASAHSDKTMKQMKVESLFLDEGFGTLDEDSLDIALDTLTSLQQQGKLIGVISHVQALKDRIHTQISVEKLSGGVSKISGTGVRNLKSVV